ncbi:hypothetical protein SBI67_18160 [Mycolicibacterium sp. 120266]|jgi:hypothetical protein|uniref:hypothetical protein n=1 Tax=Mycolicibacterium sp. 120266 TaxID=3090601 RepID=UPI00299F45E7|nr:hypothetical protein [Mycolicibacterium sp. 120266]MDX1874049.1 hypothetical protein [Mycolicibacterium sp. 120266]
MKGLTLTSLIGAAASAVALAALAGTASLSSPDMHSAAGMETGVTVTNTPGAPAEVRPPMMSAAPQITGPAPLPTEEQGLPG